MGMITSHWSTIKQTGIFIAVLSSFLQIAPIFTMPISGELCTSVGWESVYYLHAIIGFILFTKFMLYHRNKPHRHPMVRNPELIKVMVGKETIFTTSKPRTNTSKKVPYVAMYKDPAIWAILISSFGNFMGTQLSLQFMPTYINKVLGFHIVQTGMASAISPVIMFGIKICAGQSSDRIKFIHDTTKLRIYNTFALGGMGVLFITLAFCDPNNQGTLCLCLLIASTCILGFNSGGFFKSSQMVSRQHSHFTMANISFINCVCMLLTPLMNEIIAPENSLEDWKIVLCIHGSILLVTNFIFCIFCSSEPAKWTQTIHFSANTIAPDAATIPVIVEVKHS
uniref:Major facilitator superfamily (MFS) profile domain-containing protein n=1 Tax=Panagrolaimus sp. PS1159 TaxID=55785 RepID=A0AC35GTM9_9BILA